MSEYTSAGGALKLKSASKSKKKHKKEKKKKREEAEVENEATEYKPTKRKTSAELAFEKAKRQKQEKELLKKAEKTHKERIMDFNSHLDSLSEHYDIPKVSWTK